MDVGDAKRVSALLEQDAGMVGMLEVAVPFVASPVSCDEPVMVVDAKAPGVALEEEPGRGVLGGDGVPVGLEGDAEAVRGQRHGKRRTRIARAARSQPHPEVGTPWARPGPGRGARSANDVHAMTNTTATTEWCVRQRAPTAAAAVKRANERVGPLG